jgi:hypothetical protein
MTEPLAVGDIIHGFAEGAFGRDSYTCRKIEAVGRDWIVVRNEYGDVGICSGRDSLILCQRNRHRNQFDDCCGFPEAGEALTTWGRP